MRSGLIWCIGGILVTVFSYLSAVNDPFGGAYFVAWGAIALGALEFIQGFTSRNAKPSRAEIGDEAVAYGAQLEREGRVQEALALYQTVIEKYPETDAANDAKKSIESLLAKLG